MILVTHSDKLLHDSRNKNTHLNMNPLLLGECLELVHQNAFRHDVQRAESAQHAVWFFFVLYSTEKWISN